MSDETFIVRGPELVYNPPTEPLGTVLLKRMKEFGETNVHINALDGSSETFTDFRRRSICIAENMRSHGLGKGDNISICSRNQMNAFSTVIAGVLIGAPVTGLEVELPTSDLKHILNLIKPKAVFCEVESLTSIEEAILEIELSTLIVVYDDEESSYIPFSEFLKENESEDVFRPVEFEDLNEAIAFMPCTSGSTGPPKCVVLCHYNMIVICQRSYEKLLKDSDEIRCLAFASLYWGGGLNALLLCLYSGVTKIFIPKPFSGKVALDIIETYKPTFAILAAPMVHRLFKHIYFNKCDLSSIKLLYIGGVKPSAQICANMNDLLPNGAVRIVYGMTETCASSITETAPGTRNFKAIGKLTEGVTAKIVEVDTGKSMDRNEVGELWVKCDILMNGYYKNPEETSKAIDKDGWLHTGDLCYFDEEDVLFYVERNKQMLKYQNVLISPTDVEHVLLNHPAVLDCCVVGVPHEEYGDLLVAFVVLVKGANATEEELKAYVADKVSDAKKLRGGVVIMEAMPVLSSGKIKRKHLNEKAFKMKDEILAKIN